MIKFVFDFYFKYMYNIIHTCMQGVFMQTDKDIIDDVMLQFSPCFKLLGEYMTEYAPVNCSDCIHSRVNWFDKLIKNQNAYKCELYITEGRHDPVLGNTIPGEMGSCAGARLTREVCGPCAKRWEPIDSKKHMFKYIEHLDNLSKYKQL